MTCSVPAHAGGQGSPSTAPTVIEVLNWIQEKGIIASIRTYEGWWDLSLLDERSELWL
jgi:hypothetical protein